ncbi:MAG TPA: protein kinase [Chloroflexia bacterium]|nr:protein kinase [Chloroflexia bacterium]
MDTFIGRQLGKYRIETLIGRGGMATVYRAHDTVLNRSVALKILEPSLSVDPKAVERFKREAVTAANLEHPAIVRVYDVQQEGNLHYIAMRYVHGTTLREILKDNGALPIDAVINIIRPVAEALHYAHRHGVIHRDVKPGNILVEPDGSVLLTDFGIARAADASQSALTNTGLVMGTADYLAPEQISGRPAEARSDIYSLGVVLYEMLTGVTPFAGETTASILYRQVHDNPLPLRSVNPRLPAELQPVVDRALAKNPALRPADPLELASNLEEVAHWLPPGSPWLKGRQQVPSQENGKRPSGYLYTQQAQLQARTPQRTVSRPYPEQDPYEAGPAYQRGGGALARPKRTGGRLLVLALVLLGLGGALLASAAGLIPGIRGVNTGSPNFATPGPVQATQLRTGNGPDISVPKALVPLVIDGDLSDWAGAKPGPFPASFLTYTATKSIQYGGPDDLSAQFYFAWDNDNLFIGADVTDDVHVQLASTRGYQLYKGDDIEVWFDTDLPGDFAASAANKDDFQLGLSPGDFGQLGPEAVFWNPDRSTERNNLIRVASQRKADQKGYFLEAAVPWSSFGDFRPSPGSAIGFAASAGDNDRAGVPGQELMVSTCPALEYAKPLTFGNLFF